MKKYELLEKIDGEVYHQIRALRDIPEHRVKAGDLGGILLSEMNLCQDGNGWIEDGSLVTDGAKLIVGLVKGGSKIYGNTQISGGIIDCSDISGESNIGAGVTITASRLLNVNAAGTVEILESKVSNVSFLPDAQFVQYFETVDFKTWKPIALYGSQNWNNVIFEATDVSIKAECVIHNSNIRATLVFIEEDVEMNHVFTENPDMFLHIGSSITPSQKQSYLIGKSEEEALRLKTELLTILATHVEGEIVLDGSLRLDSSFIMDYSNILMRGDLVDCILKDFSNIDLPVSEYNRLENVRLDGDTCLKKETNSNK